MWTKSIKTLLLMLSGVVVGFLGLQFTYEDSSINPEYDDALLKNGIFLLRGSEYEIYESTLKRMNIGESIDFKSRYSPDKISITKTNDSYKVI